MKTHYELLGVDQQASLADIAQGYRTHLNDYVGRNGDRPLGRREQARLRKMKQAFLLLSSPNRRQAYDLELQARRRQRRRAAEIGRFMFGALLLAFGLLLIGASGWQRLQAHLQRPKPPITQHGADAMSGGRLAAAQSARVGGQKDH